jgi:GGDEF domain-containing protein
MQEHPQWGEHFKDDKEQANFPAFWRHWSSIAQDERDRGLPNQSANEFSTHEPFWLGIHKFVKAEAELDDKFIAKMVALHAQYEQDHGEIPAQMMYFHHIVPHLIEFAQHRQTHDDLADFAKSVANLERLDIELRKNTADLQIAQFADPKVPTVHGVHYKIDGQEHRAGRFLLHNGKLHHLEDYHGLIEHLLPEGKLTLKTISAIHGLKMSPHVRIDLEDIPSAKEDAKVAPTPVPQRQPRPPSVFEYRRAGHDKPHTLEVTGGKYLLDGEELSHPEVQTVLNNHKSGAATIRYKSTGPSPLAKIQQMEEMFEILVKADEAGMRPHELVQYIRDAEARGHMPKGAGDAATKHFFEDPMTPGIGNKVAFKDHLEKNPNRPGTYIQMDGNDFSKINNAFGHAAGDGAIKAFGKAAREAMDESVGQENGKLFRNGGDEFVAHVPSAEHAAKFSRVLSQKLNEVAPIGGVHQLSMSYGFGNDPATADKALYEAKKQKVVNPPKTPGLWSAISRKLGLGGEKRKYKVGQVPNLAHSLVPGAEGPIPVHDPGVSAVHSTLQGMKLPAPTKSAATPVAA